MKKFAPKFITRKEILIDRFLRKNGREYAFVQALPVGDCVLISEKATMFGGSISLAKIDDYGNIIKIVKTANNENAFTTSEGYYLVDRISDNSTIAYDVNMNVVPDAKIPYLKSITSFFNTVADIKGLTYAGSLERKTLHQALKDIHGGGTKCMPKDFQEFSILYEYVDSILKSGASYYPADITTVEDCKRYLGSISKNVELMQLKDPQKLQDYVMGFGNYVDKSIAFLNPRNEHAEAFYDESETDFSM